MHEEGFKISFINVESYSHLQSFWRRHRCLIYIQFDNDFVGDPDWGYIWFRFCRFVKNSHDEVCMLHNEFQLNIKGQINKFQQMLFFKSTIIN